MREVKLGDIAKIITGKLDANAADEGGMYPFFTCSRDILRINKYAYDCECVLLAGNGDLNVKYYKGKFNAYQRTYIIELKEGVEFSTIFIYWFLQLYIDILRKNSVGATIKYIKIGDLTSIKLPLVSLSEQERIVSLLDTQFAKIDALKANAASQLQAAKDLFQTALKQLLTPQEGWKRKMLKDVSTYYNGLTYKPTDVSDKGFLVLRSSNIQNNILSLEDQVRVSVDINEKLKIHKGDIIMCSRNGSKALIGKVAIIPEEYNDMTFGTFMMVFKGENNPFLYYFFLSDLFKKQIWRGEATMINQITRYMLDEVYVSLPSLPEQERIAARLDKISEKVKALQANYDQTITLCNDLKQSLLKSIFA